MEKVWATISRKFGLDKAANQSKDHFFSEVCIAILGWRGDRHWCTISDVLLILLFFSHIVLKQSISQQLHQLQYRKYSLVLERSFPKQLPPRYREYSGLLAPLTNPADCIRLVLEKTRYHPKSLEIDIYDFYRRFLSSENSPWLVGGEYHQLLVEYLSEVCYLTLRGRFFNSADGSEEKTIIFIMQVLSSKRQLHLKKLTIRDLNIAAMANSPHIHVNEVEWLSMCISMSDQVLPDNLLQNMHLKNLSVFFEKPSLILGFLHSLHKLAQLEMLEVIYPIYFSSAVVRPLFEAVVSLSQLENFTLGIKLLMWHSDDYCPHAEVLYKVWKEKAGGKRFKGLVFTCDPRVVTRPSENLSFLLNITRHFEIMDIE